MFREVWDNAVHRRGLVMVVAATVVSAAAGTATALTVETQTLDTERISLFSGQTGDSDLTIQAYDVQVKGKERIDVRVTIQNPSQSQAPHRGKVTVQLLDPRDEVIAKTTKATQSLDPDETQRLRYRFTGPDLVESYEETFIVVDQTD